MPKPKKNEKFSDYSERFMSDPTMVSKYPNEKQRYVIMLSEWKKRSARGYNERFQAKLRDSLNE